MLKRIYLENYKGFNKFASDLTPITIFGGKNNCGKTSILEALLLRFSYTNINCFTNMNLLRHVGMVNGYTPGRTWAPLFNNFNVDRELKIEVYNCENKKSSLSLVLDRNYTVPQNIINNIPQMMLANGIGTNFALKFMMESDYLDEYGHYIINSSGINYSLESHVEKKPSLMKMVFLFRYDNWFDPNLLAQWFGNLILSDRKKYVVECMKLFDKRITDLQTIVENSIGYIYAIFEDGSNMPVSYMGDGMNRLLNIVLGILANPNSIILLDEIENGFHYSMYYKIWEALGKAASTCNCQIIANTHSIDMLQGCVDGLRSVGRLEDLSYVRLERCKDDVKSHYFDNEMIEVALASEMEVR